MLNRGILDELVERPANFHDSARALASCLRNCDVSRKTDQSTIEATKCTVHKLLGEASDDLERVTSQHTKETLHIETTRNKRRCSRRETPCEESVWQTPTDGTPMSVPIPPSPPDRSTTHPEKLESVSKTQSV